MADQVNEMRDGSIVGHLEGDDLEHRLQEIHASRYRDAVPGIDSRGGDGSDKADGDYESQFQRPESEPTD